MEEKELNILYECVAGSHAYGTNTPESDMDLRGVAVAPLHCYLGCEERFEQLEQKVPDRIIYDIIKFFRMSADANPNMVEILYVEPSEHVKVTSLGQKILDNRDLFISKKVRYTFTGFAWSQIKRVKSHRYWLMHPLEKCPQRSDFHLTDERTITRDHQEAFIWVISHILKDTLEETKLSVETLDELREMNYHGLLQSSVPDEIWPYIQRVTGTSDKFVEEMKNERAYNTAKQEWDSYQTWKKNRNPKRAALEAKCGYDTKHVSVLIRTLREGEEILTGKGVIIKRPDAKELLDIRNGSWTWEQVESYMDGINTHFDQLYKESKLPREPNRPKINELCQQILSEALYADIVVKLI